MYRFVASRTLCCVLRKYAPACTTCSYFRVDPRDDNRLQHFLCTVHLSLLVRPTYVVNMADAATARPRLLTRHRHRFFPAYQLPYKKIYPAHNSRLPTGRHAMGRISTAPFSRLAYTSHEPPRRSTAPHVSPVLTPIAVLSRQKLNARAWRSRQDSSPGLPVLLCLAFPSQGDSLFQIYWCLHLLRQRVHQSWGQTPPRARRGRPQKQAQAESAAAKYIPCIPWPVSPPVQTKRKHAMSTGNNIFWEKGTTH